MNKALQYGKLQEFLKRANVPLLSLDIVDVISHLEDPQIGVTLRIRYLQIAWYKNGRCHRDGDRPAVVWADGAREWFKNGKFIKRKTKEKINDD